MTDCLYPCIPVCCHHCTPAVLNCRVTQLGEPYTTRMTPPKTASFTCSKKSLQHMAVCQNLVPLVNIKIAGKWMFIPLKMVLIGIDPYPYYRSPDLCWRICSGLQNKDTETARGHGFKRVKRMKMYSLSKMS